MIPKQTLLIIMAAIIGILIMSQFANTGELIGSARAYDVILTPNNIPTLYFTGTTQISIENDTITPSDRMTMSTDFTLQTTATTPPVFSGVVTTNYAIYVNNIFKYNAPTSSLTLISNANMPINIADAAIFSFPPASTWGADGGDVIRMVSNVGFSVNVPGIVGTLTSGGPAYGGSIIFTLSDEFVSIPNTASYNITVNNAATSEPISGATVILGSETKTTDTNGQCTFNDLPLGTYEIAISATGFTPATSSKEITTATSYIDTFELSAIVDSGIIAPIGGGGGGGSYIPPAEDDDDQTEPQDEASVSTTTYICIGAAAVFFILSTGIIQNPVFPKKMAIAIGVGFLVIAAMLYYGVI